MSTEMLSIHECIDRELERLHKMIEQGKEIIWATSEISRINKIVCPPPMFISSDEPGKIMFK